MRNALSILLLLCLASAVTPELDNQIQSFLSQRNLPPGVILSRIVQRGVDGIEQIQKHFSSKNLFSSITKDNSERKFGLSIPSLFKPLLLVALLKIKLALLFGKPLVLLVIKKLLLQAVLGKLLLQIPLILLGGKALLLANILTIKFALIAKGLVGFKASLTLLFLGGFLRNLLGGSGLTTILGLAGSLLKVTGLNFKSEEEDERPSFKLPVQTFGIPPSFDKQQYFGSTPAPFNAATSFQSRSSILSTPATPISIGANISGNNFGLGIAGFGGGANGFVGSLTTTRSKRDARQENGYRNSGESLEDLKLEFEAARTNGNAYLYMAAQFDEQSCGLRLLCEIYQKPQESLTQDEVLLQNLLGYPLAPLNEEDKATPKEAYYMAAQLGTHYQGQLNNQVCARFYSTCPHNAQQMIHLFVAEDIQNNDADPYNRPVTYPKAPQTNHNSPLYYPRQPNWTLNQLWKSLIKMPSPYQQ